MMCPKERMISIVIVYIKIFSLECEIYMKELFQYIPPPSSDYSGIISILFQLKDCLNILVTPKGCIKTILEIDILDEI